MALEKIIEFSQEIWKGFSETAYHLNFGLFCAKKEFFSTFGTKTGFIAELAVVEYGGYFALWYATDFTEATGIYYGAKAVINALGYAVYRYNVAGEILYDEDTESNN